MDGGSARQVLDTPSPLGSSGIYTLAGNSPQNPDVKELRGQNLENKRFRGGASWVHPTVTASIMIARFKFGRKVRCHNIDVEKIGDEKPHPKGYERPVRING
jgi:hypothetical protein